MKFFAQNIYTGKLYYTKFPDVYGNDVIVMPSNTLYINA